MHNSRIRRAIAHVNGVDLFYLDSGGNGPVMLCLHGKYGRGETFGELMRRYDGRFRIIAPDQRGHGLSGKPSMPYAGEDFAADAFALLEALHVDSAVVVGHSIGGRNAAYLAALHPERVRALVILDAKASGPQGALPASGEEIPMTDGFLAGLSAPYASREDALGAMARVFARATNIRYFQASLAESAAGYDFMFSARSMAAIDACYRDWWSIVRRIRCPVMLVRAENSWYLPVDEATSMRKQLPGCVYLEVPDSDHLVYVDNPAVFDPAFDEFVARFRMPKSELFGSS
jgi:pimeloyl-ACP methyl ester carboxylesterase